jgi:Cu(I)/Ag(I) efflux system protein CusF
MKRNRAIAVVFTLSLPMASFAQGANMKAMDAKNMPSSNQSDMGGKGMTGHPCQDMMKGMGPMKGMDMKHMDAKSCQDMMKSMGSAKGGKAAKATSYQATGVVKAVDPAGGTVTIAHGPVEGLQWPAMTMRFAVKDKALFDKLAVDKTVSVDFAKEGGKYLIKTVR